MEQKTSHFINILIFIRQKRKHCMKRKWNNNYEKETQKWHFTRGRTSCKIVTTWYYHEQRRVSLSYSQLYFRTVCKYSFRCTWNFPYTFNVAPAFLSKFMTTIMLASVFCCVLFSCWPHVLEKVGYLRSVARTEVKILRVCWQPQCSRILDF